MKKCCFNFLIFVFLFVFLNSFSVYSFNDIKNNKNEFAIKYLKHLNIVSGYGSSRFYPNNYISRAELLKVITSLSSENNAYNKHSYSNCFDDVKHEWFAKYICYAKYHNIIKGYGSKFLPNAYVTKAAALKILFKSFNVKNYNYNEKTSSGNWYNKYIELANNLGIYNNYSNSEALDFITRSELSGILYKYLIIRNNGINYFPMLRDGLNLEYAKVLRVIDGDTIVVSLLGKKNVVRLIGINAPESVHPTKKLQCYGKESSDKLNSILLNKYVLMMSDPVVGNYDKYNRLLRYVYLLNGKSINKIMINLGYSYEYTYKKQKYKFRKLFIASEKRARKRKLGLWSVSRCNGKLRFNNKKLDLNNVRIYNKDRGSNVF